MKNQFSTLLLKACHKNKKSVACIDIRNFKLPPDSDAERPSRHLSRLILPFSGVSILLLAISCLAIIGGAPTNSTAQDNYSGWEKNSPYNKLYNYKERDSLKGKLLKFKKLTPLKGMAPATSLILKEGDEQIIVHLCPWDYASPKETGLRKGVKTKIKGVWAVIDDKDVFMAAKAKQGEDFEFKVRLTKDGTPFWTMSPEEITREKQ